MIESVKIFLPEGGFPGVGSFECPDCGNEIKPPWGGHVWTCHEEYGGCGSKFTPEKGFKRVEQ